MTELAPAPITKDGEALPADGGVLVGFTSIVRGDKLDGDPSRQPGWKLAADGKPVAVTVDTLAPGLTVYRPKAGSSALVVSDADGKRLLAVTRDGRPSPQLKAPRPIRITTAEVFAGRGMGRELHATLATPAPETAIAVIAYAVRKNQRVALSFGMLDRDDRTTVVPYTDPPHCAWNPPGMEIAKPGEAVMLAWVDRAGHVSPVSTPVKVEDAPSRE